MSEDGKEKRRSPRLAVAVPVTLFIEENRLETKLVDMAAGGMSFQIGNVDHDKIRKEDVGKQVTFTIGASDAAVAYEGELLRIKSEGDDIFVIVKFEKDLIPGL